MSQRRIFVVASGAESRSRFCAEPLARARNALGAAVASGAVVSALLFGPAAHAQHTQPYAEPAQHARAAAIARGEYRLSHLETHRRMRALLNAEPLARYHRLRGYAAHESHGSHGKH